MVSSWLLVVIGIALVRRGHRAGYPAAVGGVLVAGVGSVVLSQPAVAITVVGGVMGLEGARRGELGDRLAAYALIVPGFALVFGGVVVIGTGL